MKWAEIDLGRGEWRYHVTKTSIDHLVPLARQAVAILSDLHSLALAFGGALPTSTCRSRLKS